MPYETEKFNRPNKYAGKCPGCNRWVEAGQGFLGRDDDANKWLAVCAQCAKGEPVVEEIVKQTFPLTDEQKDIVALFSRDDHPSIAVQAGAGTGKTTTLVALANSTDRVGTLLAFNADIVKSAEQKLPRNVSAVTTHALANRALGGRYLKRATSSKRKKSHEVAKWLGVKSFTWQFAGELHTLPPSALAAYVLQALKKFSQSADPTPDASKHLPWITGLDQEGKYTHRNKLCEKLQPVLERAWTDLQDPDGVLPFSHDNYIKIWAAGDNPVIPGDFILVDEAQDSNPVIIDVIERQHKQVVWVGDSQQQIYDWRGAVDALSNISAENTLYLTHSFRFGEGIAEVANGILSTIESAKLRLVGRGADSSTGHHDAPDAILCRTNAGAIGAVLSARADGLEAVLVGKNDEIAYFVRSAIALQNGKRTDHPELACFASWTEVEEFVKNDPTGEDLALWINLFEKYSPEQVLAAVTSKVSLTDADVVVSTAHKSKGLEWDVVRLAGDFPYNDPDKGKELSDSDKRLLYVAATRARVHLDYDDCAAVYDILHG